MANFCLECFNMIHDTDLTDKACKLTEEPDYCEGCGRRRRLVVDSYKSLFFDSEYNSHFPYETAVLGLLECILKLPFLFIKFIISKIKRNK